MGAELFVAYYGLQFPLTEEETEAAEEDIHPHQIKASQFGLDCHWGNYSAYDEYFLFIGKELSLLGYEYQPSKEIDGTELIKIMNEIKERLLMAGYNETPKLLLYHEPDL